ncbi:MULTISPECIES: hypothetical protein [Pseudomonas]|uniref:hypothetical protein n=1 Tax=Pseudomonas TaxID=286 RepID=UPI000CD4F1AC|nr:MULTISPECIES: hypothetical protein [Pseudomonas]RBH53614.1 hypothetical protein C3F00_026670 [Pseudomonas sp. MWU13-2860]
MHQVVVKALDVIAVESHEPEYTEAFEAARAVVTEFGESDLADRLFNDIPESVPFLLVARLFDLLAWQTEDNGAAMTRTVERWLVEGSNARKVQIALNLEVFPFLDGHQMCQVLSQVAAAIPEVANRCMELITLRQNR